MNNDRLEKLRSLLQTVNESITKQEFVTSFKAVLDFVKQIDAKNTAEFDNFKVQFKHLANSLKLDTEGELDDLKTKVDSTLKDCMAEMMVEHDAKLQAMDKKMSELRDGLDGVDGKDADEHKVMEMVLAKIPPLELEPLDVVEKLESLQGEYRLDASAIKNLPEGKGSSWRGGGSRYLRNLADVTLTNLADGEAIVWDTTTGQFINSAVASSGVDTANSPQANEFARFTDADTIEGRTTSEVLSDLGFTASITELNYTDGVTSAIQDQINAKANSSGALTQFVGNTAWRVFYSDANGDITELALGADGTFLKSNGASAAPTFATPAGSGDVTKVGTPVNNQVGVWTGDGTIEGDAALTFDTTTDTLATVDLSLSNDLLFASGSIINFNSDVTITHALNKLTVDGGILNANSDMGLRFGGTLHFFNGSDDSEGTIANTGGAGATILTITATDTRLSAAGTNSDSVVTVGGTQTLTSKTLTASSNVLGGVTMTLGSDANGDTYYRSGGVLTRLAKGTAGQVLTMNAGATAPEWAAAGSGTMAIGGSITSATEGSVLFAGASGVLAQDNTNFFWDDTNNNLKLGNPSLVSTAKLNVKVTTGNSYNLFLEGTGGVVVPTIGFKHSADTTGVALTGNDSGFAFSNIGEGQTLFMKPGYPDAYWKTHGSSPAKFHFQSHNGSAYVDSMVINAGLTSFGHASPTAYADLLGGTTAAASLRIRDGVAPTTPNDGDMWQTGTHLYVRIGGVSYQLDQQSGGSGATTALDNLASVAINAALVLGTSDAFALGSTTKMWSDLFLASGAVINFDNGNAALTHSSGILTVGTGDLRVTTAGTNTASVVTVGGTQTLTAKTLTSPAITTATLSGTQLLAEGASIGLDPSLSADGTWTGITITGTAGYTQAFGDLVYLDPTDSRWEAVDANAASAADGDARGTIGMVVVAGTDGTACTILLNGAIRADANFPALTINAPVYAAETAGDIVVTQPTTADVVIRVVGFALTADSIIFNPSPDYTTHT